MMLTRVSASGKGLYPKVFRLPFSRAFVSVPVSRLYGGFGWVVACVSLSKNVN